MNQIEQILNQGRSHETSSGQITGQCGRGTSIALRVHVCVCVCASGVWRHAPTGNFLDF